MFDVFVCLRVDCRLCGFLVCVEDFRFRASRVRIIGVGQGWCLSLSYVLPGL